MLRIWKDDPYSGSPLSQDGTMASPLVFKLPPAGGVREERLWLRHDELNGELMESSYGVVIEPADDFGSDNSAWMTVAPDIGGSPGAYSSSLSVGDVLGGEITPFWVKIDLPNTPETGARTDIYLKLTSSSSPIKKIVDLRQGTFFKCSYNLDKDSIEFNVEDEYGDWHSEWIDMHGWVDIPFATVDSFGTHVSVSYRSSSDASEASASSWVGDISDIDPSDGYLQVRAVFEKNAQVGQIGLVRRIYSGPEFGIYRNTTVGATMPFSTSPGDTFPAPKSVKWGGFFYAENPGNYTFRCVSNDGHRLYVAGSLVLDNLVVTNNNTTVTSSGTIYLDAGWHEFETQYIHVSGNNTISTYVTTPVESERAIELTDFAPVEQVLELREVVINLSGEVTYRNDVMVYDGPDVPQHIGPKDGERTPFFRPELTVFQENCEYVEFQFDNSRLFGSPYLTQWIEPCEPGTELTTRPEDGSRPPGTWYWRVRGILNGEVSAWSDWWTLEILPLVPRDEFLYLNANVGLPVHDPIVDDRFMYLNSNIGLAIHDPIVDDRFIYTNVNVDLAVGKVIYPMYDDTRPAKTEFPGDEEFIQ